MNSTYEAIIELANLLIRSKNKNDNSYIKSLINNIYEREFKDEKTSRIQELEDKVSALTIKMNFN